MKTKSEVKTYNVHEHDNMIECYRKLTGLKSDTKQSGSRCSYCKSWNICSHNGELLCENCFNHEGNTIDYQSEYYGNNGSGTQDSERCGMLNNDLFPELSHITHVAYSSCGKHLYYTQRFSQSKSIYNEKTKKKKFDEITNRAKVHGVSNDIIYDAHILYDKFLLAQKKYGKTDISRGINILEHLSGALFYAFKRANQSRNYDEISKIMEIDPSRITSGVKTFYAIGCKDKDLVKMITTKPTTYSDFVDRFCNRIGLDDNEMKEIVSQIADRAKKNGILLNNNPTSIVAGCIYFASVIMFDFNLDKKNVAKACDISVATVTKIYNKLVDNIDKIIT